MPRFSWQDLEQWEEFIGVLQAFHQVLSQHFQTPEFERESMAFRFYCASGGLTGYLTKILRRSVWHAAAAERNENTLEDLCAAHAKAVWCGRGSGWRTNSGVVIATPGKPPPTRLQVFGGQTSQASPAERRIPPQARGRFQ